MKGKKMKKKKLKERDDVFQIDGAGAMISIFKMTGSELPVMKFKGKRIELVCAIQFAVRQLSAQFMDDGLDPDVIRKVFANQIEAQVETEIEKYQVRKILQNDEELRKADR